MINFPASPSVGQQFTAAGTTWIWDGTGWNIVPQMGPMSISDTPPPNPAVGQVWWRSSNGQMYVWYNDGTSAQWVQAAGNQAPGLWESIGKYDFTSVSELQVLNLGAYRKIRFSGTAKGTLSNSLTFQFSLNNGAAWKNGASDYGYVYNNSSNAVVSGNFTNSTDSYYLTNANDASAQIVIRGEIEDFNQGGQAAGECIGGSIRAGNLQTMHLYSKTNFNGPCNALRLLPTAGVITGSFTFEGVRG